MHPEILVIGSLNMDLVVRVPRRPGPGETLTGSHFATVPGGKGANQAVAAGKLGGRVAMVGRVGDDAFGRALSQSLAAAGVDTAHLIATPGVPTGTAVITVDDQAENSIVIVPGANGLLTPADVEAKADLIAGARILLLQLEVPLETTIRAAQLAKQHGVKIVLDPAPARDLPDELLQQVDLILPNETEASMLTSRTVNDSRTAKLAAVDLLQRGVGTAIIKLGSRGALVAAGNTFEHIDGFQVQAVDTTAAGDAFAGALSVALMEGKSLHEAVTFANAVGAISTTRPGAQTSIPNRPEVAAFQEANRF